MSKHRARYKARLADRIRRDVCRGEQCNMSGLKLVKELSQSIPRFIVDHIAVQSKEKEIRAVIGMPIAVPYQFCWFECWHPDQPTASGWCILPNDSTTNTLLVTNDLSTEELKATRSHYRVVCVGWIPPSGDIDSYWFMAGWFGLGVSHSDTLTYLRLFKSRHSWEGDSFACINSVMLYGLALLACCGVVRADVTNPGGRPPIGRMKKEELTYKTLLIGGRKSHHESVPFHEIQGIIRAHMRRGNIATYTPERPHVSGYAGPMWRSACVVGDPKNGKVVKDYAVRP